MQIWYIYLRYTDMLLDVFSLLLARYQSLMRNEKGKIKLQKKVHRRIYVRDISFLAALPPSYVVFCPFFRLLSPFLLLRF